MQASNDGSLDQGGGSEVWGEVVGPHTGSIVRVKPMGFAAADEKTESKMVFRLSTSKGGEESSRKSYEEREDTQELGF